MSRKLSPLQVSIASDRIKDVTSSIDKMSDYVAASVIAPLASKQNAQGPSRRNDVLS